VIYFGRGLPPKLNILLGTELIKSGLNYEASGWRLHDVARSATQDEGQCGQE
jgi:hypothetical protein